eukprot:CAMPEP_0181168546 /NCGR_PEP_ID=MMETSP1096-20121128/334_1 /TAXON_ID=156174 ORGANISM="Chrysochromulina ericina, Strain CCMP281" /NCGR_SAMPLE_ID=MMETSP1096 /ASSEMBLY_ACC=CAM_ASM_000453 /LENGTH=180 /DNA_ID=CAMNT_0023255935 /DNA_START=1117 /DNA_END=1659 /DNA_ORIENTATION=-
MGLEPSDALGVASNALIRRSSSTSWSTLRKTADDGGVDTSASDPLCTSSCGDASGVGGEALSGRSTLTSVTTNELPDSTHGRTGPSSCTPAARIHSPAPTLASKTRCPSTVSARTRSDLPASTAASGSGRKVHEAPGSSAADELCKKLPVFKSTPHALAWLKGLPASANPTINLSTPLAV